MKKIKLSAKHADRLGKIVALAVKNGLQFSYNAEIGHIWVYSSDFKQFNHYSYFKGYFKDGRSTDNTIIPVTELLTKLKNL